MTIDVTTLLEDLVRISSVSGDEAAAATFLAGRMGALGFEARVDRVGNAVGVREWPDVQGSIQREIVLLGHIDTVPGDIPVRIENGVLYGRGTVDAKGPLATFVMAAAQARPRAGTRLVVVGAVEEEAATSRGARHIATQYRPDYCIIGEPSGWDALTLGYKGRILFDYALEGPAGHTAGPLPGVAERAVAWWNALDVHATAYNDGRERLFEQLSPSLRAIQTAGDGLTDRVSATVGVRLPPAFEVAHYDRLVRELAGDAEVSSRGYEPAYRADRRSDLVRAFSVVMRQSGIRPRLKLKTGTSDMNVVGPTWQCPILAYGPGDSLLDHTPAEHIVLDEYRQAISVLENTLNVL